ncbi:hypothetical protein [Nostoc sp.]|uniref:hypothetical protein n=1 Tax=Nostoc sp. TaxID=1180 RepID=UPI002FF4F408
MLAPRVRHLLLFYLIHSQAVVGIDASSQVERAIACSIGAIAIIKWAVCIK